MARLIQLLPPLYKEAFNEILNKVYLAYKPQEKKSEGGFIESYSKEVIELNGGVNRVEKESCC